MTGGEDLGKNTGKQNPESRKPDEGQDDGTKPAEASTSSKEVQTQKSKRTPEQRRKIAYDRIKKAYEQLQDKQYLLAVSRVEVLISKA